MMYVVVYIYYTTAGYFGISTGVDGWLLKQLHPGMTPVNNLWEACQQVVFGPLSRIIAVCYLLSWDSMCRAEREQQEQQQQEEEEAKKSK